MNIPTSAVQSYGEMNSPRLRVVEMRERRTHQTQKQRGFKLTIMSRVHSSYTLSSPIQSGAGDLYRLRLVACDEQKPILHTSRDPPEHSVEVLESDNFVTDTHSDRCRQRGKRIPCWETKAYRSEPVEAPVGYTLQLSMYDADQKKSTIIRSHIALFVQLKLTLREQSRGRGGHHQTTRCPKVCGLQGH